jgi:DNA-binding cell septation regulator SpoVG
MPQGEKSSSGPARQQQITSRRSIIDREKETIMSVNGIEITEIKINPLKNKEPGSHLEAFARIVLNGQLCINSIRVVQGKFGPFISFPREFNQKEGKGYNLCYPITKALQDYLSERILRQWRTAAA